MLIFFRGFLIFMLGIFVLRGLVLRFGFNMGNRVGFKGFILIWMWDGEK